MPKLNLNFGFVVHKIVEVLKTPSFWLLLTLLYMILYAYKFHKKGRYFPDYFNLKNILVTYRHVFCTNWDFGYPFIISLLLSFATSLARPADENMTNLLGVIISILISAVISFMGMTSSRADMIRSLKKIDVSDSRTIRRNAEAISIGMFEIVISVAFLIFIFIRPIFENSNIVSQIISVGIYFFFYDFMFNLHIMMRRLYQIYHHTEY